jgi:PDZ domain-containing protein
VALSGSLLGRSSRRTVWLYAERVGTVPLLRAGDIIEGMTRRSASLAVAATLLVTLVAVAFAVPMPYVVLAPGVTENTLGTRHGNPVIAVTGHPTYPTSGHLDLTTVSVTSPDYSPRLPEILQAWWSTSDIVIPRDAVYPPAQSIRQVEHQNRAEMLGSQRSAVVAGLASAGFDALNVTVESIAKGAPANGVLRKGDVIVAVEGHRVHSTQQVVDAISSRSPGDTVTLRVERSGTPRQVTLTTQAAPGDASSARIGVGLRDAYAPPFGVKIQLGQDIGGPSAGLMFSLAVYDVLTPGPLTGGRFVAGTGTIDVEGHVGVIGGIQQKMAGAYDSGARVFLAPSGDCAEAAASGVADRLELVKVTTLTSAIAALHALQTGNDAAVPRCQQ